MKTTIALFIAFLFSTLFLYGQTKKIDSLLIRVDSLKSLLSKADTLTPDEANVFSEDSSAIDINTQIADQLTTVLLTPSIIKYRLDSLLRYPSLGIAHSKDNRLWIFSWYENTGGSWKSDVNFICYRSSDKTRYIAPGLFDGQGAGFDKIYKLPAPNKNLYLAFGSGISCNTCMYEIAIVIELKRDSINYSYPAFKERKSDVNAYGPDFHDSPYFMLETRMGNMEKFEYDVKTQTLKWVYIADDRTGDAEQGEKIKRYLKFNGKRFVGKYE